MKKVMEIFKSEKKDCILNSRNRNCREKYDGKTFQPEIGKCDALTKMLCKEKGKCDFYKSKEEWKRAPLHTSPASFRAYPVLFKLKKVR